MFGGLGHATQDAGAGQWVRGTGVESTSLQLLEGSQQRGVKIPPGTSREKLDVCPFFGSLCPISLTLPASCSWALRGRNGLGSKTRCGFAARHVSLLAGCPRKSGQQMKRLIAEGFPLVLVQLGSHRKTWVPEQPIPCSSGADPEPENWGTPSCLLTPARGGSHLLSGAGFAGGMRMESCGAEVLKTA